MSTGARSFGTRRIASLSTGATMIAWAGATHGAPPATTASPTPSDRICPSESERPGLVYSCNVVEGAEPSAGLACTYQVGAETTTCRLPVDARFPVRATTELPSCPTTPMPSTSVASCHVYEGEALRRCVYQSRGEWRECAVQPGESWPNIDRSPSLQVGFQTIAFGFGSSVALDSAAKRHDGFSFSAVQQFPLSWQAPEAKLAEKPYFALVPTLGYGYISGDRGSTHLAMLGVGPEGRRLGGASARLRYEVDFVAGAVDRQAAVGLRHGIVASLFSGFVGLDLLHQPLWIHGDANHQLLVLFMLDLIAPLEDIHIRMPAGRPLVVEKQARVASLRADETPWALPFSMPLAPPTQRRHFR